jgi:hypothetical protein
MTNRSDMIREVEGALARLPKRERSGRFAVCVPGEVVIGTYDQEETARAVSARWAAEGAHTVVVDREA